MITLGREERGERTRGSQGNPKPNEEHNLSCGGSTKEDQNSWSQSQAPGTNHSPTQSKQSSLQSPIDVFQRQSSKHSLPCVQEPAVPRPRQTGRGRSSTNTGPPSPVLGNQLLHAGWTILLLNELISLPAEADKDHSSLTFALEGMIFITNLFCFCCYGLHSGNEQGGNFTKPWQCYSPQNEQLIL